MGAVWGAVSGKFVITAAGLLIASRVDRGPLQALVTPRAAHSAVTGGFAERRHLADGPMADTTGNRRALSIGIGAEAFDQPRLGILRSPLPSGADMIIGRDILSAHVLAFDMRRHQATLLEKGAVARLSRRYEAVPLSMDDDGELHLPLIIDGVASQAAIDFDQVEPLRLGSDLWSSLPPSPGEEAEIVVGRARLHAPFGRAQATAADHSTLGLAAFGDRTIILDLPHERLWIGPSPTGR